ncbi:MAG TPA: hypothetical protein VFE31_13440 [Opitutaceae bacterium]|jgi:ferredoxin|nr:hypothetical protein [Opitutaceae bacterium]
MTTVPGPAPLAGSAARPFDLLRVPILGGFLRRRWARAALQAPVFLVAVLMAVHALFGPQLAPKNFGSLVTWVHFRGLVVLALLCAGNLFCMACPFMFLRDLARRWAVPRWNWPRPLRNKLPAVILFAGVLFAYEWLSLWADPWATGLLIVGYFAAALLVDLFFRKASFCKYVCPIGQFNFLGSTLSPFEISVRDANVCGSCRTKDCITGRRGAATAQEPAGRVVQRGCELGLFQPRKVGNLDCTFCLDCVHACPHDNVGLHARLPGEELVHEGPRSGAGDLARRTDWTLLIVVFVFGAVLNAFAMISPVYALERAFSRLSGVENRGAVLGVLFGAALVAEPAVLLGGAAWCTRRAAAAGDSLLAIINRFSRSLVPMGFGVWLAHYGFHFFTGALTVVPVTQYAVHEATGAYLLGLPRWSLGGLPPAFVYPLELSFMVLGFGGSLLVGWRVARTFAPSRAFRAYIPWASVAALLFAAACWTMSQPMDMRVTFLAR